MYNTVFKSRSFHRIQLRQVNNGEVACSCVTVTVFQTSPSRFGMPFGAARLRDAPPFVCARPRRELDDMSCGSEGVGLCV